MNTGISRDVNPQSAKRKSENLELNKRYSNPSLRELSTELERLSKMAGIDASDAVTLARTLSSNSIGYTSVERLAMDELGGVNPSNNGNTTPNVGSPYSLPTPYLSSPQSLPGNISGSPYPYYHNESSYPSLESGSPSQDFSLKRSRRLDYRTLQRGGSGLQTGVNDPTYNNANMPKRKPSRESQFLFRVKPRDSSPTSSDPSGKSHPGHSSGSDPNAVMISGSPSNSNGSYQYQGSAPNTRATSSSHQKPLPGLSQLQYSQRQAIMGASPYPSSSLRKTSQLNLSGMVGGYPSHKPATKQYQKQQQLRQMSQQLPGMNVSVGMGINPNMSLNYPKQRSKQNVYPKYPVQNHPSQQQGYIPQKQTHPSQQQQHQGYHVQQQAVPSQQQGYPSKQPGYQPQQQGYQGQPYQKQGSGHRLNHGYPISTGKQQGGMSSPVYQQQQQQQQQLQAQQLKSQGAMSNPQYHRSSLSTVPSMPNSQTQLANSNVQPQQISPRSRRNKGAYAANTRYHTTNPSGKSGYGAAQSSINQNLDLLRSEINEFKETLNKTDGSNGIIGQTLSHQVQAQPQITAESQQLQQIHQVQQPQQVYDKNSRGKFTASPDNTEVVDISFDTSTQDVSYEDTLGIEQEVLKELELEHQKDTLPQRMEEVQDLAHQNQFQQQTTGSEMARFERQTVPLGTSTPPSEVEVALEPQGQNYQGMAFAVPEENQADEQVLMDIEESKSQAQKVSPVKKKRENMLHGRNESDDMDIDSGSGVNQVLANSGTSAKTHVHKKSTDSASSGRPSYENAKQSSESKRSLEKSGVSGLKSNQPNTLIDGTNKSLKMKKSWGWLRERSASFSSIESKNTSTSPIASNALHANSGILKTPHKTPLSPKSPTRSVSNPEISSHLEQEEKKANAPKENMITKLFKKKKTSNGAVLQGAPSQNVATKELTATGTNSSGASGTPSSFTVVRLENTTIGGVPLIHGDSDTTMEEGGESDYDSEPEGKKRIGMGIFKKKLKLSKSDRRPSHHDKLKNILSINQSSAKNEIGDEPMENSYSNISGSRDIQNVELDSIAVDEIKDEPLSKYEERTDVDQIEVELDEAAHSSKNSLGDVVRNSPEDKENVKSGAAEEETISVAGAKPADKSAIPSTLDIQEKIKKSIKRTSRANQPIQFTDSAFGFPLPPPSQSTLIMLDYRFPVHVERAIYRLSHLKLANPKRSLREQVLLSNFMYAYLNLVDHTLHLEQQQIATPSGASDTELDDEEEVTTKSDDKKKVKGEIVSIDLSVVP